MTSGLSAVQYLALSLLPDFKAPLGVILPEVRILLRDESITAARFDQELRGLETAGLVVVTTEEPGKGVRKTTEADRALVVAEYEGGERDITQMQQRFDAIELWLEITKEGRHKLVDEPRDFPEYPLAN